MNHNDEIDCFLGETIKKAGLQSPSHVFVSKVMEKVRVTEVKKSKLFDWDLIIPVFSIVASTLAIIAIFPSFFLQVFSMAGFDDLAGSIQSIFENFSRVILTSGANLPVVITSVLSIASLLLLDKIMSGVHRFRTHFLTAL
jgi:hypothetical protein